MTKCIKKRWAIYTRKSVDEGQEQAFNSLDAQREACEAYITSQKANGWVCLKERFDDGGFSGGNTSRPALKQLLAECRAGNIDVVLVYKIDRLSRSICDFAELTKFFDQNNISFCAVTQQIDTSTSSGRMMLNILVTFAQYEREIIAERIRDKFAASKKKGMWMGGAVPLGYRVENRKLLVVPEEAETIKRIYSLFLTTQSPTQVALALNANGLTTKAGKSWSKGNLYHILRNCIYVGKLPHKGNTYDGEHEAILDQDTWDRVQRYLASDKDTPPNLTRKATNIASLKGLVCCGHCGGQMMQVVAKRKHKSYIYFKCTRDSKRAVSTCPIRQVSSTELERVVFSQLSIIFRSPMMTARLNELTCVSSSALSEALSNNFFNEATSQEKRRLAELMIASVKLFENKLELEIKAEGIKAFQEELEHENND